LYLHKISFPPTPPRVDFCFRLGSIATASP
jgi:hypothetical protein